MKNYVISLTSETLRRQHIDTQFSKQGVDFEFFNAITPVDNELVSASLKITSSAAAQLSAGEFSCLLSHVSLWQKAINEHLDYIAIYEDDIHIGQNAADLLKKFDWIPEDCDVVKLEAFYTQTYVSKEQPKKIAGDRALYALKSKHVGGAAYILSRHAAQILLLEVQQTKQLKPIDHIIFDDYIFNGRLKIQQMLPALCIQDYLFKNTQYEFSSALESGRRRRFKAQSKQSTITNKIKREVSRLLRLLSIFKNNLVYIRKIVVFR